MLYVLCGHGHGDSGACGYGYQEYERVRALANRMKAIGGGQVNVYRPDLDPYSDGVLSSISVGSSDKVIELHLDSASASAAGGHVIIKQGFAPDEDDSRLASFISGVFPGRSQIIAGRSDLGNVNTAAARGINYRLLEVCFISNYNDITKFNNNLDAVAKGILTAMGVGVASATPASKPVQIIPNSKVKRISGANRYETNLLALKELLARGASKDELFVASGKDFADALSASASGKLVMIVGDALTSGQKALIKEFGKITILGGTGAVSVAVQNEISKEV